MFAPMVGEAMAARGQIPVDVKPNHTRQHDAAYREDGTERVAAPITMPIAAAAVPRRRTPCRAPMHARRTDPARRARSAPRITMATVASATCAISNG